MISLSGTLPLRRAIVRSRLGFQQWNFPGGKYQVLAPLRQIAHLNIRASEVQVERAADGGRDVAVYSVEADRTDPTNDILLAAAVEHIEMTRGGYVQWKSCGSSQIGFPTMRAAANRVREAFPDEPALEAGFTPRAPFQRPDSCVRSERGHTLDELIRADHLLLEAFAPDCGPARRCVTERMAAITAALTLDIDRCVGFRASGPLALRARLVRPTTPDSRLWVPRTGLDRIATFCRFHELAWFLSVGYGGPDNFYVNDLYGVY